MKIVETRMFTKRICTLLEDDEYRKLQADLIERPDMGPLIRGGGGIRKIRWGGSGRGKRGGVRVVYYWFTSDDELFMLFAFATNEQGDLTPQQVRLLSELVDREAR